MGRSQASSRPRFGLSRQRPFSLERASSADTTSRSRSSVSLQRWFLRSIARNAGRKSNVARTRRVSDRLRDVGEAFRGKSAHRVGKKWNAGYSGLPAYTRQSVCQSLNELLARRTVGRAANENIVIRFRQLRAAPAISRSHTIIIEMKKEDSLNYLLNRRKISVIVKWQKLMGIFLDWELVCLYTT